MKKRAFILVALIGLLSVGCDRAPMETREADQCLRAELFEKCMNLLPAGPDETVYNDWDEVVSECGTQAYYQSIRYVSKIKDGCR